MNISCTTVSVNVQISTSVNQTRVRTATVQMESTGMSAIATKAGPEETVKSVRSTCETFTFE